jgi:peptidoglycan/xylan/chitin deacetylase (PgdA/CDA1 family)
MRIDTFMKRQLRHLTLSALKAAGAFRRIKEGVWRRDRLLILCYHGIAIEDENEWHPHLYMSPALLDRRFALLREGRYNVLPLAEALERLFRKDLPPFSVAITFDDGGYDFYRQAWPVLKKYELPAAVYITTYYSETQRPTPLICSYMLWKARQRGPFDLNEFGISQPASLSTPAHRQAVWTEFSQHISRQDLSGEQKDQIAAALAKSLGIDYTSLRKSRILSLMNCEEVRQLCAERVDFQLHTHRHRTPLNEELFRREIRDNRASLAKVIPGERNHFCYPSGAYRPEFMDWLAKENVLSATTCDTGLATTRCHPLLLPRLVDTSERTDLEFESWLTGIGHLLSRRRRAALAYARD